jgi:exopolysaccharide production protein ExoQ
MTSGQTNKFEFLDIFTVFMIVSPIHGMFYPLESYLAAGSHGDEAPLAIPVNPISLILISIYVGVLAIPLFRQRKWINVYAMYIFILAAALTFFWSPDPGTTAIRVARLCLLVGLSVVITQYYTFRKLLVLMSIGFLLSGSIPIIVSIAFPDLGLSRLGGGYENTWRGAAIHKNSGGLSFSIGIIIAYYSYRLRCIRFWLFAASAASCGIMLVMGNSATSIIALGVVVAVGMVLGVLRWFAPDARAPIAFVLGSAALLLAGLLWWNAESILQLTGRDMTFTGRSDIWAAVYMAISEHPFRGYGYAFWGIDSPDRQLIWAYVGDDAAHSHNSWLDAWLQTGIFGMLAVIFVTVSTFLKALWFCVRSNDESSMILISIITFLLVRSFFEVEFTDPAPSGLFWLIWVSTALRDSQAQRLLLATNEPVSAPSRNRFGNGTRSRQIHLHDTPYGALPSRPMATHGK